MSEIYKVRSSSFGSFFDCDLRWARINLYGDYIPSTAPAAIGSAVHESTAVFDQHTADGDPISVLDAAEVAVKYIQQPEEEVNWGDVSREKAIERALGVHTRYCNDVAPKMTYHVIERTLDPLQIQVNEDVIIELTGTLDRIYSREMKVQLANQESYTTGYGVSDVKTGLRALSMNSGKHKAQVGIYSMLAEESLGIQMTLPETIIALQTSDNYGAEIKTIINAQQALLGDGDENPGLLRAMGDTFKRGYFVGNSSSWLCSEKFCPYYNRCIYK